MLASKSFVSLAFNKKSCKSFKKTVFLIRGAIATKNLILEN